MKETDNSHIFLESEGVSNTIRNQNNFVLKENLIGSQKVNTISVETLYKEKILFYYTLPTPPDCEPKVQSFCYFLLPLILCDLWWVKKFPLRSMSWGLIITVYPYHLGRRRRGRRRRRSKSRRRTGKRRGRGRKLPCLSSTSRLDLKYTWRLKIYNWFKYCMTRPVWVIYTTSLKQVSGSETQGTHSCQIPGTLVYGTTFLLL